MPNIINNEFTLEAQGFFLVNVANTSHYFNGYPNMLIPGYNGFITVPGDIAVCNSPYAGDYCNKVENCVDDC